MRAGHFKEFMDEPYMANREERPRQWSPDKIREVLTIIGGFHIAGESRSACDRHSKEAKTPPQIHVHRTEDRPMNHARRELEDIIFTEANTRWVHHPHANALVITVRIANNSVHRLMVDDGNAIDILYLNTYKRMGLIENEHSHTTFPLYRFAGDHVILRGIAKLAMIVGEHPRVLIVIVEFLVVDYSSTINWIIGRPLLKALKVVTSIYHLTMKFLTAEGTGKVRGSQYDSRECYNKSLKLSEKERSLPQKMEVEKVVVGPSKNSRS